MPLIQRYECDVCDRVEEFHSRDEQPHGWHSGTFSGHIFCNDCAEFMAEARRNIDFDLVGEMRRLRREA